MARDPDRRVSIAPQPTRSFSDSTLGAADELPPPVTVLPAVRRSRIVSPAPPRPYAGDVYEVPARRLSGGVALHAFDASVPAGRVDRRPGRVSSRRLSGRPRGRIVPRPRRRAEGPHMVSQRTRRAGGFLRHARVQSARGTRAGGARGTRAPVDRLRARGRARGVAAHP